MPTFPHPFATSSSPSHLHTHTRSTSTSHSGSGTHTPSRSSVISHANSSYSRADSTRPILADMHHGTSSSLTDINGLLAPTLPFASAGGGGGGGLSPSSARGSKDNLSVATGSNLSLSVNYLPTKFSASIVSPGGTRNRKGGKGGGGGEQNLMPKRGGGLEAFRSNEARMPQGKGRLRWNKFKWILLVTNSMLVLYSLAALVVCLLTWFDIWEHADIIRTGNHPELVLSTLASCIGLLTSLIGFAGILLNNRGFLAWYTFFTWITFALLVTPGYMTYKKRTFNLEGKINAQWSRALGPEGRARIQNQLKCCGYFSPFVEATITQTCYARSILPGCKLPYLDFERFVLKRWYAAAFVLVPFQLAVMVAGLLCSNHVTYRFGKGMMPEAYRLNMSTMAVIMENYANQLADQYGADIADEILKKSRLGAAAAAASNIHSSANAGYGAGAATPMDSSSSFGFSGSNNAGGGGGGGGGEEQVRTHAAMSPIIRLGGGIGMREGVGEGHLGVGEGEREGLLGVRLVREGERDGEGDEEAQGKGGDGNAASASAGAGAGATPDKRGGSTGAGGGGGGGIGIGIGWWDLLEVGLRWSGGGGGGGAGGAVSGSGGGGGGASGANGNGGGSAGSASASAGANGTATGAGDVQMTMTGGRR
ncbi:hypothetical protein JR316_0000067 [Psilocybe cubensis]|uniref:Tetraspanin Tsp2 n=2 Tax=Psilocybe cubensis TaxID=181762 RepID=A0A8H8CPX0_PSICU|nr:hypothetical protein JR316_0000067 [Psilocybe cubensis]KAH9486004.1 hypothetical protein JR316_0000067 [Psilocybe cubensis]